MSLIPFDIQSILNSLKEGKTSKIKAGILRRYYRSRPPEGIKVVEEDWDILVVLDACRYDTFRKFYDEGSLNEGELSKKTSRGSMSIEWLNRNFTDYYGDIVYISANSFVSSSGDTHFGRKNFDSSEHFYKAYQLFMNEDLKEGDVVSPEKMTDKAIELAERHQNKRLIVHYMQPHAPYIGENHYAPKTNLEELVEGLDNKEKAIEYYEENLERVIPSVERLIDELDAKFVVTADHGELLGEYGMWRHPHSVYLPELIEVPWLEIEKGERRELVEEEPAESEQDYDEEDIKKQLADLGYGE